MTTQPTVTPQRAQWLRYAVLALLAAGLLALALWPTAQRVDSAVVESGTVRDTFEAEGRTRVRDRYVLTAPMAGWMQRIAWEPGDAIRAGETLALLDAAAAPALDARARETAQALHAAAQTQARSTARQAQSAQQAASLAQAELLRAQALAEQGMVSQEVLQRARTTAQRSRLEAQAAQFQLATAEHQLSAARAALHPGGERGKAAAVMRLTSPVDGVILRRHVQSARSVQPGEPLMEVGDPRALEVEADVLSSDAVRLQPGMQVELLRWGGDPPLNGLVRRIEPQAFTKVSALGVEEQRVWVHVEIQSPAELWRKLGEAYRVQARFVLASTDHAALHLPVGALFRNAGNAPGWSVFLIRNGRAHLQPVEIGLQGEGRVQVLKGVNKGERVVLHPPRDLEAGARVETP